MKGRTAGKLIIAGASLIGLGGGAIAAGVESADYHDAQRELTANSQKLAEQEYNMWRLEKRIGENCMRLVLPYLPGKNLDGTPEDSALADLIGDPDKACGEEPTKVRGKLRETMTVYKDLAAISHSVEDNRDAIKAGKRGAETPEEYPIGAGIGLAAGAMAVGFWRTCDWLGGS